MIGSSYFYFFEKKGKKTFDNQKKEVFVLEDEKTEITGEEGDCCETYFSVTEFSCFETGCETDYDCENSLSCSEGRCVNPSCKDDTNCICNDGLVCFQEGCNEEDKDCEEGLSCIDDKCMNPDCETDENCVCDTVLDCGMSDCSEDDMICEDELICAENGYCTKLELVNTCAVDPSGFACCGQLTCNEEGCNSDSDCAGELICNEDGKCANKDCLWDDNCICPREISCFEEDCENEDKNCGNDLSCIDDKCINPDCKTDTNCICDQQLSCFEEGCEDEDKFCEEDLTCVLDKCVNLSCEDENDCICDVGGRDEEIYFYKNEEEVERDEIENEAITYICRQSGCVNDSQCQGSLVCLNNKCVNKNCADDLDCICEVKKSETPVSGKGQKYTVGILVIGLVVFLAGLVF